jgi:hypothetical protein
LINLSTSVKNISEDEFEHTPIHPHYKEAHCAATYLNHLTSELNGHCSFKHVIVASNRTEGRKGSKDQMEQQEEAGREEPMEKEACLPSPDLPLPPW